MIMHLKDFIINVNESIYYAHWKLYKNKCILIVIEDDETVVGLLTINDFNKTYANDATYNRVGDICNRNFKYVMDTYNKYEKARSLFSDFGYIRHIPVIDENMHLVDIVSKEQAFWKQYFNEEKLPRMHYAYSIYMASLEAKMLGYKSISVIEFGVAGGSGLMNCEFHAKAISRLLDINIEIYGFDREIGLPMENRGYKDMIHLFRSGDYKMNLENLTSRLEKAKLVIGDLSETTKTFLDEYEPAPIGCMLIDVDYYSSSLPILDFLKSDVNTFLPRVYTYWDDISPEYEFQGESLAIHEFNENNDAIKIAPEKMFYQNYRQKIKICHLFSHPRYNDPTDVYVGKGAFKHDAPFFFHELPINTKMI